MQIEFNLDPLFYGIWHQDLNDLNSEALKAHWENHGKAEGRSPSFSALASSLIWPFGEYKALILSKILSERASREEARERFVINLRLFLLTADFSAPSLIQPGNEFDPHFYSGWYDDLSGLSVPQLIEHWKKHGLKEGRQSNFRQLLLSQGLDADLLPNNFQAAGYVHLNKSIIKNKEQSPYHLAFHYLTEGRVKGLSYYFDPYFYRYYYSDIQNVDNEFALLNHYKSFGQKEGRLPNLEALLNKQGQLGILARLRVMKDLEWIKASNPHLNTADLSEIICQTISRKPAQRNILFVDPLDNANFYADLADWWMICEEFNAAIKCHHTALSFYPLLRSLEALSKAYAQTKQDHLANAYREVALKNGSLKRDLAASYLESKNQQLTFDDLDLVMQANAKMNLEKAMADRAKGFWAQVNAKNKAHASLHDREVIAQEVAHYAKIVRDSFKAYYNRFSDNKRIGFNERSRRVLIIGDYHIPQCVRYRINQKLQHLRDAYYEPESKKWNDEPKVLLKAIQTHDIIIFYRCPAIPSMLKIVEKARSLGKCCIYEIDDLIFTSAFPPTLENYASQIDEDHYTDLVRSAPLYAELAKACHFGIGSTALISSKLQDLVIKKQSFIYRNALDEFSPITKNRPKTDKTFIDLFYGSATLAHNADFTGIVLPVIIKLMRQYPAVRLVICGHLDLGRLIPNALSHRVKQIPFLSDVAVYMEVLSTADINLAVLEVNEVTNSKSELKWIEAASLGIPSVVSNTSNYLDVIEDGKTGLIASNQQEWQKHLERLIKNSKLREEIGNNALAEVESKYNTKVMSERIDQILTSCLANFNSNDEA